MATIKVYRCDACGAETADAKSVRKVFLEWGPAKAPSRYANPKRQGVQIDICSDACSERLAGALTPFLGDVRAAALRRYLVPPPPKPKAESVPKKTATKAA